MDFTGILFVLGVNSVKNILILLSMRFFSQEIILWAKGRTGGGDIERMREIAREGDKEILL